MAAGVCRWGLIIHRLRVMGRLRDTRPRQGDRRHQANTHLRRPDLNRPHLQLSNCERLENAHEPSREGVERLGVEEEVGHAQKRHGDEQSINPVFDGWPQFGLVSWCRSR